MERGSVVRIEPRHVSVRGRKDEEKGGGFSNLMFRANEIKTTK